jgi:hypothetical protein
VQRRWLFLFLALLTTLRPLPLRGQAGNSPVEKPEVEEWVYRVRYGYQDEWWRIFRKYQIAILERQKQLGYVKDYR